MSGRREGERPALLCGRYCCSGEVERSFGDL